MKIKITRGTFGHVVGHHVIRITAADGPVEVSDEVGARLVRCGVAELAEEAKHEQKPAAVPSYSSRNTRAHLVEVARSVGINEDVIADATTKADLIGLIDAAVEGAPVLDAEGALS